MADVEMTPINPAEEGGVPPVVAPFGGASAASPAAPVPGAPTTSTIRLKPVIRKPMIHKPTIGGSTPPPPPPPAVESKKATASLKSVTGPIPAQAVLKKTGIVAEGIITPEQKQAAKSKTSRISLESVIGVAPAKESAAPMKTIRLRRPTNLKSAGASESAAAPEPPTAVTLDPVTAPTMAPLTPVEANAADATVTQKKTLKLHRPGVQISRPGVSLAQPSAGDVPDLSPVPDLNDVADMAPVSVSDADSGSGVPAWVAAVTSAAALAALLVIGFTTYKLYDQTMGVQAGKIGMLQE